MPTLDIYEHAGFVTVSEMRHMIARAVSKLKGDSQVTYTLNYSHPSQNRFLYSPIEGTVSDMRRNFAHHLSHLYGDKSVTFSFHCKVEVV